MFYLETKDGDRFFTDKNSDDRAEFEKIIEQKLGQQAVEMFRQLIEDAENRNREVLAEDIDYIISELREIREHLDGL